MRRGLLLSGSCLAGYLAALDNTVVAVALRDVQSDLGAGVSGLQGVVTGYVVALAALLLTGGTLADLWGRRRVLMVGLAVFAGASAGCALAPGVAWLVAARCVQGAGAALVVPASLAVLAAAYPDAGPRARAIGLWAASGALALVAGPVTGGLLVQLAGWRAVFWVNVPLCALVAVLCAGRAGAGPAVPAGPADPAPDTARRIDLRGQLAAAGALGAGTYAVVLAGRDGVAAPVLGALAAAGVLAAVFVVAERRAVRSGVEPVLPVGLLRDRAFGAALVAAFAASLAIFVLLVFMSLLFQLVEDDGPLAAAVRLLPLTAGAVVAAPLAAAWAAARGPRVPVTGGLLLCAGGLLGCAGALHGAAARLEVLLAVAGAGAGLTGAPVVAAALATVSRTREGLAGAAVSVGRELGGIVAVAGLGSLVVNRLAADLLSRLHVLGTTRGPAQLVVDLVLRGVTSDREVLAATHGTVGLDALLALRSAATASYLSSTRVALLAAAGIVGLAAVLAGAGLRGEVSGRSPRARVPPAG